MYFWTALSSLALCVYQVPFFITQTKRWRDWLNNLLSSIKWSYESDPEFRGVFHWQKAKCHWAARSGLWVEPYSLLMSHIGGKNKRDGSAFSGYNARVIHVIRDAYIPSYSLMARDLNDLTIGRHLSQQVMVISTCTKYESAPLQTVWSIPMAGPTLKIVRQLNLDYKILLHTVDGTVSDLAVHNLLMWVILGPISNRKV